jgi:hypothetical protein
MTEDSERGGIRRSASSHWEGLALIALLVLTAAITLEAVKIQTQRDPKFDFSPLKTWAWTPSGPGDVKVWVTAESKSEPVKRQYEPVLMQAVEEQLAARGYTRALGAPDFFVTYFLLVTTGSSSTYAGQFLPSNAQWGIPPFPPSTVNLTAYPQGTLVLDVQSPGPGDQVWRGMAEAKIEMENSEAKRVARLRSIIKDLLAKFPKKKT